MGSVKKRGDSYRARYWGPDHRQHQRTFARKLDADNWLIKQQNAMVDGDWVDPAQSRMLIGEWMDEWLESRSGLTESTLDGYERLVRVHVLPTFGDRQLGSLLPIDVQTWVARLSRRRAASTTRSAYFVFKSALDDAVKNRKIRSSPCVDIELPRVDRPHEREANMTLIDDGQIMRLASSIDPRWRVFVLTLGFAGLRFGEGAGLRRSRVDLPGQRLHIAESVTFVVGQGMVHGDPKSHQARRVPIPAWLRDELAQHMGGIDEDPRTLLFTAPEGGEISNRVWVPRFWQPAVVAAGLPEALTPHDLRHSCASMLIAKGFTVIEVQHFLGHAEASTTLRRYAHLWPDSMDRVAEAFDDVAPARGLRVVGQGQNEGKGGSTDESGGVSRSE